MKYNLKWLASNQTDKEATEREPQKSMVVRRRAAQVVER